MVEAYREGEYVRYAVNGVCRVDEIRQVPATRKDPAREFYVLKPVADPGSTILVPTNSEPLLARMSRLPDREELDRLILSTREEDIPWIEDRKIRNASFQVMVKNCDLRELICLVSCIYRKRVELTGKGKKLSASDEGILRRAEDLIENEVSFVLGIGEDQVSRYIGEKLELYGA